MSEASFLSEEPLKPNRWDEIKLDRMVYGSDKIYLGTGVILEKLVTQQG